MKTSICVLAVAFVAFVAGSVSSNFADENEELYENPASDVEMHIMPEKRGRGGLDPMAGMTFGSVKKRIDALSGGSFGTQKRSDEIKPHSYIRKNILINDRHLDKEQPNAFLKKSLPYPYPYYMTYAPFYYHLKDKGI